MLWWQPFADTPMNGLGMKHGNTLSSRPTCFADLAERGQVVGGLLGPVEVEVELDLAGRVLVVALDHVQPHRAPVLDHLVDDRLELRELVDVVAVGLGDALDVGRPVLLHLQPHHLGLGAGAEVEAGRLLELGLQAQQVAAAVGGEVGAGILALLAVAEALAPDARDLASPTAAAGTCPARGGRRARPPRGRSRCSRRAGRRTGSRSRRRRAGSPSRRSSPSAPPGTPLPMMRPVTEGNW